MKISKSKKQLAQIISENGGWREGANFSAQDKNASVTFFVDAPWRCKTSWEASEFEALSGFGVIAKSLPNWHQTIISRDEYFHLYPAPDSEVEQKAEIRWVHGASIHATPTAHDCMKMLKEKLVSTQCGCDECSDFYSKPATPAELSIEQLAADYHNAKDYADRKQQEADAAKADAEGKLAELVAAGKALGLVLSVVGVEPELVITDWRDLLVGDEIECVEGAWASLFTGRIGVVAELEEPSYAGCMPIRVELDGESDWGDNFRFIRRPTQGAINA